MVNEYMTGSCPSTTYNLSIENSKFSRLGISIGGKVGAAVDSGRVGHSRFAASKKELETK